MFHDIPIVLCLLWAIQYLKERSMGVRPEKTIYNLNFEGMPAHEGLQVKISSATIREMNFMMRQKSTNGQETADSNDQVARMFLDHLVSWNLDGTNGTPLPQTMEGIDTLEPIYFAQIIMAWQLAMMTIPTNLSTPSPNGGISAEESLELGSVSQSRSNWPKPSSS
jgi:hypothetical protein